MGHDYLDVHPEPVISAGNNTARTSSDWASWASHSEALLRGAAGGARQGKVSGAFETYLSQWNPTLRTLPVRAENLGTHAVSATTAVDNADAEGATTLGTQTSAGQQQAGPLSRPVNGPY